MKTFAAKKRQLAPAVHKPHHNANHPMGPAQQAQQAEIRRILRSTGAQAKLTIGQPNDKYEQEADRVANQVMRMSDADVAQRQPENEKEEEETLQTKSLADQIIPLVQRQEELPEEEVEEEPIQEKSLLQLQVEEEEEPVQEKSLLQRQAEEEEEPVQEKSLIQRQAEEEEERKIDQMTISIMPKIISKKSPLLSQRLTKNILSHNSSGSSLPRDVKNYMNQRFNKNFSVVQLHTDSTAEIMCKTINAKAFTKGINIFFGKGYFNPATPDGKELIAHELTHVLQQRENSVSALRPSEGKHSKKNTGEKSNDPTHIQRKLAVGGGDYDWDMEKADDVIDRNIDKKKESLRRELKQLAKLMISSNKNFDFPNESLFLQYLQRRHFMIKGMTWVNKRIGRKKCCGYDSGSLNPRVNLKARDYWVPVGGYRFNLTPIGKNAADEAIQFLFWPQEDKKDRTLLDCKHFTTVVHYYGLMKSIGKTEFRQRVKKNELKVKIIEPETLEEAPAFLEEKTVSMGTGVLTAVTPNTKDDFIPGDFVYFGNHKIYSALTDIVRNPPPGTTSPPPSTKKGCQPYWRGEHAVYRGIEKGKRKYQGHGTGNWTEEQIVNILWKHLKCHVEWARECRPPIDIFDGCDLKKLDEDMRGVKNIDEKKKVIPGLYSMPGGQLNTIWRPLVK